MRSSDIEGLGDLAGEGLAAATRFVQAMHDGIARRPFSVAGEAASPVREVHDGIAGAVYAGVATGLGAGARIASLALTALGSEYEQPLADRPAGSAALSVLNGLYGDHLARRGAPVAGRMELRRGESGVPLSRTGLATAYPDAGERVVAFAHGLFGDEYAWRGFPPAAQRPTYGERLQNDLGLTPVMLRYNTGLHISQNAEALAGLLEQLCEIGRASCRERV